MSGEFEHLFKNHWNDLVEHLKCVGNEFVTQKSCVFLAYYNNVEDIIVIIPQSSNLARFISKDEYLLVFINEQELPTNEKYLTSRYNDDITKNASYIFSFMKQF